MKKKLIGLSMLLLVLLLGLSTTCFAKTLTATDFKNFYANAYRYNTNQNPSQTILDRLENMTSVFETWANYTETYEGQWLIAYDKSNANMLFYYITGSLQNLSTHQMYYYSNTINVNTSYLQGYKGIYRATDNYYYQIGFDGSVTIGSNPYLYTDKNIKSNVNGENNPNATNKWVAGQSVPNENLFAENYFLNTKSWGVYSYPYEEEYQVQNFEINGNTPLHRSEFNGTGVSSLSNGWSTAFFGGLDEFDHARATYYRFDNYVKQWRVQDRTDEAIIWGEDEEDNSFWLYIPCPYYYGDSVVILSVFHKTDPSKNFQIYLYLVTNNTIVQNGTIMTQATINNYSYSGDNGYMNNNTTINNQNDTQSIVDTLTDDSQVDGMLSEFTNGDSDDMANKLGYTPFANPFTSFLQNIFNGIIDALLNDQDVQLNFGFGGKNYYVSSADFTTPENNTFINLAKWALIFAYIYGVYRFGWLKIQKLSEFDLDKSGSYTTSERPGRITYGEEELPFDML